MRKYALHEKIVLLSFAIGGIPEDYRLHTFQPWNPNQQASDMSFCVIQCTDADKQEFELLYWLHPNDTEYSTRETDNWSYGPAHAKRVVTTEDEVTYFSIYGDESTTLGGKQWISATDYMFYLSNLIDDMMVDGSAHIYAVEHRYYRLRRILPFIERQDKLSLAVLNPPLLSIPKTCFDGFCAEYDPKKGQRWGQAFHDYMKADKCTQDRSWWDRLYFAESAHARALVLNLLDYQS